MAKGCTQKEGIDYKESFHLTHLFLVYVSLIQILSETKRFDRLIKPNVPTPRHLLKPINGLLQLAYQAILFVSYKALWLLHIDVLLKIAIQECSLDVHLVLMSIYQIS